MLGDLLPLLQTDPGLLTDNALTTVGGAVGVVAGLTQVYKRVRGAEGTEALLIALLLSGLIGFAEALSVEYPAMALMLDTTLTSFAVFLMAVGGYSLLSKSGETTPNPVMDEGHPRDDH